MPSIVTAWPRSTSANADVDGQSQRLLRTPGGQPVLERGRRRRRGPRTMRAAAQWASAAACGNADRQLVAQRLGEQVVVAVPLVATVQRHQEQALAAPPRAAADRRPAAPDSALASDGLTRSTIDVAYRKSRMRAGWWSTTSVMR